MSKRISEILGMLRRHLKLETIVLATITISLVITTIVLVKNNNAIFNQLEREKNRVCLTPSCIESAAQILTNMDQTISPCTDFYKFACGNFWNDTNIPDDKTEITPFIIVQNKVYQQLRAVLEQVSQPDEIKPFRLMKSFYNICMNTTNIEEDGLEFVKVILESLGGWPVLEGENWSDAKFDWKNAIFALRYFGYDANYLLDMDVITDLKNSSRRVISLDQANLGLNLDILKKGFADSMVQMYYNYMVEVAILFGANRSLANDDLQESLKLEMELAKISVSLNQHEYRPVTITELQKLYPDTNWKQYIKYLLDIPNFQIGNDETIILRTPKYMFDLEDVLKAISKRAQANYIMWRAVSSSIPYLTAALQKQKLIFLRQLHGEKELHPLWRECAHETLHNFWKPLSILYEREHSNEESRRTITEMLKYIEDQFVKLIGSVDWMDTRTKKTALKKAKSLPINIGFLDEQNEDNLIADYSTLNFSSENYLMAALAVSRFRHNNRFKKLRQPVDQKDKWQYILSPYGADVPLGIFQTIFFNNERPTYSNYGAIGTIIAHMITHVFDNYGKQYDENGNNDEWWTDNTERAFNEKARCIVEQYENYFIPELGIKLDGRKTRDENIAENTGIKVAYLAYKTWIEDNSSERQLPGLNYTAQQMFWIFYANVWCERHRTEELQYFLSTTAFSPAYYGVIGSLSNSDDFAQDFDCPLGSKMSPKNKCNIW